MDAKKFIKKRIMPRSIRSVLSWILLAVTVIFLISGISAGNAEVLPATEFFPSESEVGTMAYIDVAGLSQWVYDDGDGAVYYSAEDANGYFYTVRLYTRQFNEMSTQQAYWNRETDSSDPEVFHLEGLVTRTGTSLRNNFSQAWEITPEEYDQYFGTLYLDATTSVSESSSAGWYVAAFFFGLIWLLVYVPQLSAANACKRCLRNLEEKGLLEQAAQQLQFQDSHISVARNRGILTQHFLFGQRNGIVLPYNDIFWLYQSKQRYWFIPVSTQLMAATAYLKPRSIIALKGGDRHGHIAQATEHILQHNPNILIGYTRDNMKAFGDHFQTNK